MKIGNLYFLFKNKARRKELEEILKNFNDISIDNVNTLVRYSSKKYIVWLDIDNEFDWETTHEYITADEKTFNKYISRLGVLQHCPTSQCLSKKQYRHFNYMLAETVVLVLEGALEEAEKSITEIEAYLDERNCEISRKWQLGYCFYILFALLLLAALGKIFSPQLTSLFNIPTDSLSILGYSALGALGASLSIIQKSGKTNYDCRAGRLLNFLEIFSRMFAGIISSFFVIYLYKADLIFSGFKATANMEGCLILICIIAGFSERLVPSIIGKFEKNETKE